MDSFSKFTAAVATFFKDHFGNISAHTLGLLAIVLAHFSSIPTLMAVLLGKSDRLPPVDLMLFVWASLIALFFKSLIDKNSLYTATIAIGFVAQTVIMSLILFR